MSNCPARAGFTSATNGCAVRTRDHPRSRGVYERVDHGPVLSVGIIPARAGFTRSQSLRGSSRSDHPRSRGVYSATTSARASTPRIIPARAGFTLRSVTVSPRTADHPRSRGVYHRGRAVHVRVAGSSPLARGLQGIRLRAIALRGIIPARAGFTSRPDYGSPCAADHPRSRGVYLLTVNAVVFECGSSPLARGLRTRRSRTGPQCRDHPRSRGVYEISITTRIKQIGSSPLARGLLRNHLGQGEYAADHPRSRGVYATFGDSVAQDGGSSPLARGLPPRTSSPCSSRGIIPARAGFTMMRAITASSWRDHPRSRGVYMARLGREEKREGSSPLARGLPHRLGVEFIERGIIPARAGFTHRKRHGATVNVDHPRSRGVYPFPGG